MKKAVLNLGMIFSWTGVILQYYLSMSVSDSRIADTVKYLSFMTIWTNFLIALFFTFVTVSPGSKGGKFFSGHSVQTALLVYIIAVGLIYHLFLAHIWDPKGYQYVADQILHTVVPLYYLMYWVFFTEKTVLNFKSAFNWLLYPLVYAVYAMVRGAITMKYPYYFLDAVKLGYPVVLRNIALIAVSYFMMGGLLIAINNMLVRRQLSKARAGH
ncbi:MAG: Pr6Pr family membrane protein [Ignavibacteria bacterium]|nr:Pr6Pr family membrane protein [Ignavibacteria bacterium]